MRACGTLSFDILPARSETNLADTPLAEYIWTRLGPFESVLDFGSGKGDAVRHYYERGAKIAVRPPPPLPRVVWGLGFGV